jgi:hypothetical protein
MNTLDHMSKGALTNLGLNVEMPKNKTEQHKTLRMNDV